ncbi:MAG: copper homeostasis protein CutC [Acidobacteriaceae bacterium]
MAVLEICVESVEAAIAAEAGGAQRIELCSSLNEGGLTPSIGMMRVVRSVVKIAVHAMIRPRAGDFLYSEQEFAAMREDIAAAAECGMDGVALGLLNVDGNVDVARTRELIELARPMEVTFHRAIDMTPSVEGALEDVIRAGADRVLTSGAEPTAMQGRNQISRLIQASSARIRVMVGGGVRADNVRQIAQATHAREYHASLRRTVPSSIKYQRHKIHLSNMGTDEYAHNVVRTADVRTLRKALDAAFEAGAETVMQSADAAPENHE